MRSVLALFLVLAPLGEALAHLLDDDATVSEQVEHQLIGAHHLPLLALVILLVYAMVRLQRRRRLSRLGRNRRGWHTQG